MQFERYGARTESAFSEWMTRVSTRKGEPKVGYRLPLKAVFLLAGALMGAALVIALSGPALGGPL